MHLIISPPHKHTHTHTHTHSAQLPLINKLPDSKLTACLINNQQIAAWERRAVPGLDSIRINPQPTPSPRRTTRETPRRERLFEAACSDVDQKQLDRGATWVWQSAEEAQRRRGDGGGENTVRETEREKQLWNHRKSHRGRMDGQRKDRMRHSRQGRREIFSLINRCLNFNYRWPQSSVRKRENKSENTPAIRTGTAYVRDASWKIFCFSLLMWTMLPFFSSRLDISSAALRAAW